MIVINKTFLKVIKNRGINGFPYGIQNVARYFIDKEKADIITDDMTMKINDRFYFIEGPMYDTLLNNKNTILSNVPEKIKAVQVNGISSASFIINDAILENDTYYAATSNGIAYASKSDIKKWTLYNQPFINRNLLKIIYNKETSYFFVCSREDVYFSTDNCQSFIKMNYNGQKTINSFDVKYSENTFVVVIGTNDGIVKTSFVKNDDYSTTTFSWIACPKKETEIVPMTIIYPSFPNGSLVQLTIAKRTKPQSNTITYVEYNYGQWIFGSPNGLFSTIDFQNYSRISKYYLSEEVLQEISLLIQSSSSSSSGGDGSGGDGSSTPTTIQYTLPDSCNITYMKKYNSIVYYRVENSNSNGLYKMNTIDINTHSKISINSDETIKFYIENVLKYYITDSKIYMSFDGSTFTEYTNFSGAVIKTIIPYGDELLIFTSKGLFSTQFNKIDVVCMPSILTIDKDENRKVEADLKKKITFNKLCNMIINNSRQNSAIAKENLYVQNKLGGYVFIEVFQNNSRCFYLFGVESRFNELKLIASEFGIG